MPNPHSKPALLEALEARQLLANVVWDGGPDGLGTDMSLAINWVGDVRPGTLDIAIIDTAGPALELSRVQPLVSIQSVREINLRSGGTLTTTGASSMSANLNLLGGVINGGTWNFSGSAAITPSTLSGLLSNVTTNAPIVLDATSETLRISGTIITPAIRMNAQSSITLLDGATLSSNVEIGSALGGIRTINIDPAASASIGANATIRHISGANNSLTINIASNSVLTNLGTIEIATSLVTITGGSFIHQGSLRQFGPAECRMQSSWINQGTVLVTGGTLNLTGAFDARAGIGDFRVVTPGVVLAGNIIDNTGQALVFNNTTGNWTFAGATINGGSLDFQQAATMNFSSNGGITLQNVVALQAASVGSNQHFRVGGTTTIPSIRMLANSALYFLPGYELQFPVIAGSATAGSYLVTFHTDGPARASIGTNGSLRVLPIAAGGLSIGTDTQGTPLINLGEIISEAATSLWIGSINNSGLISISAGSFRIGQFSILTSTGTIRTTGGDIRIDGTWDMTGGTGVIDAYRGSITLYGGLNLGGNTLVLNGATGALTLQPSAVISGGTLTSQLSDSIRLLASTSPNSIPPTTFANVAFSGTVMLNTNVYLNLTGTTQSSPLARYELVGSNARLLLSHLTTFAGTAVALGPVAGERIVRQFSPLAGVTTFAPGAVVELDATSAGVLTIGYPQNGTIVNQGTVRSRSTTQMINVEHIFTNQGTVTMTVNGTIQFEQLFNTGLLSASTGTFYVETFNTSQGIGSYLLTGATVRITDTIQNTGSTFTLSATSGTWIMQTGSQLIGGSVSYNGTLQLTSQVSTNPFIYRDVSFPNGLILNTQNVRFRGATTASVIQMRGTSILYLPGGQTISYPIAADGASSGLRAILTEEATSLATGVTLTSACTIQIAADCGGDLLLQGYMTNFGTIRNLAAGRAATIACAAFENRGLVEAAAGSTLLAVNYLHRGTVRTLSGATLQLLVVTLFPGVGTFETTQGTISVPGTITNTGNTLIVDESVTRWTFSGGTLLQGSLDTSLFPLTFSTTRSFLDGVAVVGDLLIRTSGSVAFTNTTSVSGAIRLAGGGAILALPAGYVLNSEIRAEGSATGNRTIQLAYNSSGAVTTASLGSIRISDGSGGDLIVNQAAFASQLINQGTIANESAARTLQVTIPTFQSPGTLRTRGTLLLSHANTPNLSGTIFIGAGGVLQIAATVGFTLPATANLNVELGSTPGPATGALRVTGTRLVLGGNLTLQKASNADLPLFATYAIAASTQNQVQGSFASVTLPEFDADEKGFTIQTLSTFTYTNTTIADFNNDLTVDLFDYLDFVASFADNSNTADINNDGIVDFFDYLDFVVVFSRF